MSAETSGSAVSHPYRDAPLVVSAADPPGRRWKLHPFRVMKDDRSNIHCPWCATHRQHGYNRAGRCHGRRFLFFFRLLCPRTPHHHMSCTGCGAEWLEQTCDEALFGAGVADTT